MKLRHTIKIKKDKKKQKKDKKAQKIDRKRRENSRIIQITTL